MPHPHIGDLAVGSDPQDEHVELSALEHEGHDEELDWIVEPGGDWDWAQSLQVFGWSENGDLLLWDTSGRDASGEFPIWESAWMQSLHRRGSSLDQVLAGLRQRAGGLARELDIEPLPPARL